MRDLKLINIYTPMFQKKNYFFNVGFKAISYIYTLYLQEKSYVFSMWDKKLFDLNTSI